MLNNDLNQIIMMHPVRLMGLGPVRTGRTDAELDMSLNISFDQDAPGNPSSRYWDGIAVKHPHINGNPTFNLVSKLFAAALSLLKPKRNVVAVFEDIKNSLQNTKPNIIDIAEYTRFVEENSIEVQSLFRGMAKNELEKEFDDTKIIEAGYEYIKEEDLVKFILNSERGLCLSELYFYDRTIPKENGTAIMQALETGLFDNIYILHYDGKKKNPFWKNAIESHKAEIEKKKDPIAFGVKLGSTHLYYITDWEDEHCDLTFKKLKESLTTIGE